jgi:NAD(P)-dependent dehydrogenase (short-subunit alcohol dehydrogenase family)
MDTDVNASLRGRVAFVTGASSGMGRHFSALLAGHGAAVALVARRLDALEEISASIQATGARAIPIACDIADRDAVRAAVNRAEELLDAVPTIVVNSGGIIERIPAIEMPEEKWDRVIWTNLTGTFNVA